MHHGTDGQSRSDMTVIHTYTRTCSHGHTQTLMHSPEIRAENFGKGLRLQVLLERLLGVQPEALAGPRATGAPRTLLRARAADGRHQQ